jgi:hypothetical protein
MITSGVLLIEPDAPRPRCFEIEADSHPNAWVLVKQTLTPAQLEDELSATGWTFFFMAGPLRMTAFGFDREKTVNRALKRGIRAVRQQGCNCLQIESVEMHSFLGIPRVSMSIRPRHIQRGMLFAGPSLADGASITAHGLRSNVAAT